MTTTFDRLDALTLRAVLQHWRSASEVVLINPAGMAAQLLRALDVLAELGGYAEEAAQSDEALETAWGLEPRRTASPAAPEPPSAQAFVRDTLTAALGAGDYRVGVLMLSHPPSEGQEGADCGIAQAVVMKEESPASALDLVLMVRALRMLADTVQGQFERGEPE